MKYRILENSFLGNPPDKDKTYIIIGAGVAGLMAGYYFKKAGISFKIVEKSDRAGGMLQSHQLKNGVAEQAANGFLWNADMAQMCNDIGLELMEPNREANGRFLVRDLELRRMPLTLAEGMSLIGGVFRPKEEIFETIEEFGTKQFGPAVAAQMLEPAFAGIYGAHISQLSFPGAMTKVAKLLNTSERLPWAVIKSRGERTRYDVQGKASTGTHSFKGGIEDLTKKLAEHLKEEIVYNTDGIQFDKPENNLVITAPANVAKEFFKEHEEVYKLLDAVKYVPLISTTFFLKKSELEYFKDGFGCLIPRNEEIPTLGVLFNSCIFENRAPKAENPEDQLISLTCMLRPEEGKDYLNMTDEEIKAIHVKDFDTLFDFKGEIVEYKVFKWEKAIPLYSPELYNNWFTLNYHLKNKLTNINLFGNYTGEVSIRGMAQSLGKFWPVDREEVDEIVEKLKPYQKKQLENENLNEHQNQNVVRGELSEGDVVENEELDEDENLNENQNGVA